MRYDDDDDDDDNDDNWRQLHSTNVSVGLPIHSKIFLDTEQHFTRTNNFCGHLQERQSDADVFSTETANAFKWARLFSFVTNNLQKGR